MLTIIKASWASILKIRFEEHWKDVKYGETLTSGIADHVYMEMDVYKNK